MSHREEELLNCRNHAEFYKYLNKSMGKPIMPIQLTNSLGDIISAGLDSANAFNFRSLQVIFYQLKYTGNQRFT